MCNQQKQFMQYFRLIYTKSSIFVCILHLHQISGHTSYVVSAPQSHAARATLLNSAGLDYVEDGVY